jgi:hypothetical protein
VNGSTCGDPPITHSKVDIPLYAGKNKSFDIKLKKAAIPHSCLILCHRLSIANLCEPILSRWLKGYSLVMFSFVQAYGLFKKKQSEEQAIQLVSYNFLRLSFCLCAL